MTGPALPGLSARSLTAPPPGATVRRWSRQSITSTGVAGALLGALFLVPYVLSANGVQQLTSLFIFVIIAVMWNTLAGYGGLVSIGQQAFIGFGAYGTIHLTQRGVPPFPAMILAAVAAGGLALPLSVPLLRLRGGQFAIGTWVVAETLALLVALDEGLGGGTGTSLRGLNVYSPVVRQAYTYWFTLGFLVLLLGIVFALLRSRHGVALQAVRDDQEAAASLGIRVQAGKRMLFVLAAFGCGAAGALTLANTLFIQPQSIFGVHWTAYMLFMVLVGGMGTFEGPIVGALIFFALQYRFADSGAWYLIGLGVTAVAFALLLPRGLWGLAQDRWNVHLLPVGYRLERTGVRGAAPAAETD